MKSLFLVITVLCVGTPAIAMDSNGSHEPATGQTASENMQPGDIRWTAAKGGLKLAAGLINFISAGVLSAVTIMNVIEEGLPANAVQRIGLPAIFFGLYGTTLATLASAKTDLTAVYKAYKESKTVQETVKAEASAPAEPAESGEPQRASKSVAEKAKSEWKGWAKLGAGALLATYSLIKLPYVFADGSPAEFPIEGEEEYQKRVKGLRPRAIKRGALSLATGGGGAALIYSGLKDLGLIDASKQTPQAEVEQSHEPEAKELS